MEKPVWDLVVIGAGASGLMAAAAAGEKSPDLRILVLEKEKKPGKRLLATGNGRCNLSNRRVSPERYHGDSNRIRPILERFSPEKAERIFRQWGLPLREEGEGRLYPYNLQASAVEEVLRRRAEDRGVQIRCEFPVEFCRKEKGDCFAVGGRTGSVLARRVVFSSGGLSYPSLGGSESGWNILRELGHSMAEGFPALVQLQAAGNRTASLKGARCRGEVTLVLADGRSASSQGEIQFTDKGLSGICILELSRLYGENPGQKAEVICDLMPEYSRSEILRFLRRRTDSPALPAYCLLDSMLQKQVGREIMRRVIGNSSARAAELTGKQLFSAAELIKRMPFSITGTGGWETAQVTAGGVRLHQVNLETMESKVCGGVYLAGEVLNIDGDCGGFNLHWAWCTGFLAGISAAESLLHAVKKA